MNKRKKKKAAEWWKGLELHEKEVLIKLFVKKGINAWSFEPNDDQLEKMYDWSHG